jgi:hypothetical protein
MVAAFLNHLENDRHNSPHTRNLRLTAIRSLFAFAALRHPEHAEVAYYGVLVTKTDGSQVEVHLDRGSTS